MGDGERLSVPRVPNCSTGQLVSMHGPHGPRPPPAWDTFKKSPNQDYSPPSPKSHRTEVVRYVATVTRLSLTRRLVEALLPGGLYTHRCPEREKGLNLQK